jgi:AcrR family transcriptional regulator
MLAAARRVFAREGLDAPLDVIAREAGVGRGTQHRHFPTRGSLIRAIFDDDLEELSRISTAAPDPADAFLDTLLAAVDMLARDRGFVDLFHNRGIDDEIKADINTRFLAILAGPLGAAQAAGRIRPDLSLEDTLLLVDMLGAAASLIGPGRPEHRTERAVALVLEAIGPAGRRRSLNATEPAFRDPS